MRYLVVLAALLSLTEGYDFYYDMIERTQLPMEQRIELDKNCRQDVQDFHQNEENIKKYRFRSHWVQSNPLTDKIGYNFRKKETMVESIKKTMSTYKRKKRQATNNQAIQKLLNSIGQSCEKGKDLFKGSFTSEDVTCNASDDKDVYRRFDGVCNNLEDKNKGAAGTAMTRLAEPAYADGIFAPRKLSKDVSPRVISNNLHRQTEKDADGRSLPESRKGFTHMTMQFGQMLDHDITLTPQGELECCDPEFLEMDEAKPALFRRCLNIPVPADDDPSAAKCLPFTRSDVRCTPGQPRQQFNGNTAFIDGSLIYGSDEQTASRLRKNESGLMIVSDNFEETNLPTRSQCGFESPNIQPGGFFDDDLVAGDVRAIVQPTMASIHTLFLAEHNRIAKELQPRLAKLHPNMSPAEADELIYQQTRAIVGAELQQIVYQEYLPVVLGQQAYQRYGLSLKTDSAYDPSVDPSILNEFSTVAFRFGHSTVSDRFDGNPPGWSLRNQFFKFVDFAACRPNGKETAENNNGDCWISEMHKAIEQPSAAGDLLVGEALREKLFNASSARFGNPIAEDLVARNIQRAREHGIPSYGDLRKACGMKALHGNERPNEINDQTWNTILGVYHSAADIDPFTGGLAETSPVDGIVGPLFACIIGKQFQNLKDGDRYFFTHSSGPHARGLGLNSKNSVMKRSFGDILCDNQGSNINGQSTRFPLLGTQKRVFSEKSTDNEFIRCNERVSLDFDGIVSDFNNKKVQYVEVEEAIASSTYASKNNDYGPQFAIDGKVSDGNEFFLHTNEDSHSWAQLKLSIPQMVSGVEIFNRVNCCGFRLHNLEIRAGLDPVPAGTTGEVLLTQNEKVGFFAGPGKDGGIYKVKFSSPKLVKFITFQLLDKNYLQLNEVKVIGSGKEIEEETAILITGGWETKSTTEVYFPSTNTGCSVRNFDLPVRIHSHTMDTFKNKTLLCGGGDAQNYCLEFSPTSLSTLSTVWAQKDDLNERRYEHTSWVSSAGIVLIGGYGPFSAKAETSAELVGGDILPFSLPNTRDACAITDASSDSFILTGGTFTPFKNTRYNLQGLVENLPNMNRGRAWHGCGSYVSGGKRVILVAGGQLEGVSRDSTEKLVIGERRWSLVSPLPRIMSIVTSLNINNKMYLLGGRGNSDLEIVTDILEFNADLEAWEKIGDMQVARYRHAAAVIYGDFSFLCN